jgi:hypothetical protein
MKCMRPCWGGCDSDLVAEGEEEKLIESGVDGGFREKVRMGSLSFVDCNRQSALVLLFFV